MSKSAVSPSLPTCTRQNSCKMRVGNCSGESVTLTHSTTLYHTIQNQEVNFFVKVLYVKHWDFKVAHYCYITLPIMNNTLTFLSTPQMEEQATLCTHPLLPLFPLIFSSVEIDTEVDKSITLLPKQIDGYPRNRMLSPSCHKL